MTNSLYLDYIKDPQNSTVKTKKQQKEKYPIGKWVKDMYRHFIKKIKYIYMANKHIKIQSTSFGVREMQF